MPDTVIAVDGLSKRYRLGHAARHDTLRDALSHGFKNLLRRRVTGGADDAEFWALRDVSFAVQRGEALGIIGRNGAGKSTLLKILSRITEPTEGRVTLRGRVASLLEVGTGFHPELSGRENVFLNGAILGMSRVEIRRKFDEIVAFAEVEKFLDSPVKHYSSGMYVRLAFAVAAHLEPEILIVDEVLAVGDVQFQQKCLGKMQDVAAGEGRTVLFVSHNTAAIAQLCTHALFLEQGRITYAGAVAECLALYAARMNSRTGLPKDVVKILDPRVQVDDVRIMGQQASAVHISSGTDQLRLDVDLRLSAPLPLSVEAHLRGQFGESLAFYSPGHVDPEKGVLALPAGRHRLRAVIRLPSMNRGQYTLDLALTRPGIAYYAQAPGLCVLQHEGTATPTGIVFDQSAQGAGFMMLEGSLVAHAAGERNINPA